MIHWKHFKFEFKTLSWSGFYMIYRKTNVMKSLLTTVSYVPLYLTSTINLLGTSSIRLALTDPVSHISFSFWYLSNERLVKKLRWQHNLNLLFLATLVLGKLLMHPLDQAKHPDTHLNLHLYHHLDETGFNNQGV